MNDCCDQPLNCPPGQVPGPAGAAGTPGVTGIGINAFTTLGGLGFTVPAVSANVPVVVVESAWMAVGAIVYIPTAGFYQVAGITDETDVVLTNLGYPGNAVPTTVISPSLPVVAAGLEGPTGAAGGGVTSVALSVIAGLAVTGSPVTGTGTLGIIGDPTTLQRLFLASPSGATGAPLFRALAAVDLPAIPASTITGQLPLANGGTAGNGAFAGFNNLSPTTTKGDLIVNNGSTGNVRLAVGTNTQVLTVDSTQTVGMKWAAPAVPLVTTRRRVTMTPDVMLATDSIIGISVAGAVTETLVAAPADGRRVVIKDESSAGATNNITILAGAGDTIQGAASEVIGTNYGYRSFYYDAADKIWFITGSA